MAEAIKISKKAEAGGVAKAVGGHYAEEIPVAGSCGGPNQLSKAPPVDISENEGLTAEEIKAKKRAEIEAKLAELKLNQAKEAEQKANFFGDHTGITCDGCGAAIIGYRYKCKDCANHDTCENCYDEWTRGKVTNNLGKQVISSKAEDHRLCLHKDKNFSSLVKKPEGAAALTEKKAAKVKPNDPCTCGSGKKYKKCCAVK